MTFLDAAIIFTKTDVQLPMQIVFNPPMTTQYFGILTNTHCAAAYKVPHLRGRFAFARTLAATHAHGLQLGPGLTVPDTLHMMDHHIRAVLLAAMSLLRGAMLQHHMRGKLSIQRLLYGRLNILQQMLLVTFHGQDIVPAASNNLSGDFFLTTHGVDAHQRSLQVQQLQQGRNGRDFVALIIHSYLSQRQVGLGCPGTDQVQRTPVRPRRAAQRLAVDGDVAHAEEVGNRAQPGQATALKRTRLQVAKHALEGVVRRHSVGQLQEPLEPRQTFLSKENDFRPVVAVGDDTTDCQHNNVHQQMPRPSHNTRIFQPTKVFLDRAHRSSSSHAFLRVSGRLRYRPPENLRRCTLDQVKGSVIIEASLVSSPWRADLQARLLKKVMFGDITWEDVGKSDPKLLICTTDLITGSAAGWGPSFVLERAPLYLHEKHSISNGGKSPSFLTTAFLPYAAGF